MTSDWVPSRGDGARLGLLVAIRFLVCGKKKVGS